MSDQAQPTDFSTITGGTAAAATVAPTAQPPVGITSAAGGVAATVWNNGKIVNALWSINQDRNSWVGVQNVGWVKLSTASDSGVVALTVLASQAKQLQSVVNYRTESDNMIHEIYAW